MGKNILEMSKNGKSEYSCTVVRIGALNPIEGSDFLAQTFIGDASLVVRKDQVNEGDLLFYAANECQLMNKFLKANNLYSYDHYELNSNKEEVEELKNIADLKYARANATVDAVVKGALLGEADKYYKDARAKCGFFNANGRVRMIRLKGCPSMGYLFSKSELVKAYPAVNEINMEELINTEFDTVDGELFVKAYVPPITPVGNGKERKREKKVLGFDRMVAGEFALHYETKPLDKNLWRVKPTDVVDLSVKLHGTSGVFSNILVKFPKKIAFLKRMWNKIIDGLHLGEKYRFIDYVLDYDHVYSSRNVIKNQYINEKVTAGYYKYDIWNEVNNMLKPFVKKGMTVYGEICGYAEKMMIQKGYDYKCEEGEWFFMPYRISTKFKDNNGEEKKFEWNVSDVRDWTVKILSENPGLEKVLMPIPILYHGTLQDLYPEISTSEHWHENVLHAIMNDKRHFGMEELEPMCKNKVPREGLVLRINNDPMAEAFKIKCLAFREREAKAMDKGEVDIEMAEAYGETENEN